MANAKENGRVINFNSISRRKDQKNPDALLQTTLLTEDQLLQNITDNKDSATPLPEVVLKEEKVSKIPGSEVICRTPRELRPIRKRAKIFQFKKNFPPA